MTESSTKIIQLPAKAQEKICTKCKVMKALTEFYFYDGKHISACRTCQALRNKKFRDAGYKEDPESKKKRRKRFYDNRKNDPERSADLLEWQKIWNKSDKYYEGYYKRKFGITFGQVKFMLIDQNNLCANIGCSRPIALSPTGEQAKACVDHDHKTGKVRGMMCIGCNTFLGYIEKNQRLVPGLMNYLAKHNN